MSILVNKNSKVIVQGFTGKEGSFHSEKMIAYGTNVIGGVTPGKGGKIHLEKPVFNTVEEAVKQLGLIDVSIIFVPAIFAADVILEAAYAGISLIVCITEGIPILDMIKVKYYINNKNCKLIGPNCPGIITVEETLIGIMPSSIFKKGNIGIISRSGTLTYEVADQIVKSGYGISTAIGIGGDYIIGFSILEIIKLFMNDPDTDVIVLIGEIGGQLEIEAAKWIKNKCNKAVIGFIAGVTAPKGRIMGHAGAIIGGKNDTAQFKIEIMKKCGMYIVTSLDQIGYEISKIMKKYN
ncbi:MAG: succinate--CoA ligase subunit alpha [Candidatus Bostrichicola ureolyticus]|nr:MAG: succinate--CoA ligase subunit alpha [Candidatus Bostrichicola ureolyticus]